MRSFFIALLFAITPLQAEEISDPFENQIAALEAQGGESRFMQEFLYMLFLLGAMVALLLGGTWLMKRFMVKKWKKGHYQGEIKILDAQQLSQRSMIYVIEIQGTKIALAESHSGTTYLGPIKKNFEEILHPQSPQDTLSEPDR